MAKEKMRTKSAQNLAAGGVGVVILFLIKAELVYESGSFSTEKSMDRKLSGRNEY
jgi:hypothetical protein